MSRIDVIMPQMGESIVEGTVSRWMKQIGEAVQRDEAILEISTDKVDAEAFITCMFQNSFLRNNIIMGSTRGLIMFSCGTDDGQPHDHDQRGCHPHFRGWGLQLLGRRRRRQPDAGADHVVAGGWRVAAVGCGSDGQPGHHCCRHQRGQLRTRGQEARADGDRLRGSGAVLGRR